LRREAGDTALRIQPVRGPDQVTADGR